MESEKPKGAAGGPGMTAVWESLPGGLPGALSDRGEALVARPARARGVVLVLGELFGCTALVTDAVARLATAGLVAIAPDLYWRDVPRAAFGYDRAGRDAAFAALAALRIDDVVADCRAALELGEAGLPVHLLGFSSGGNLALDVATRLSVTSVTAVYPGWLLRATGPLHPPAPLERAEHLDARVTIVAGSADALVAPDLPGIEAALAQHAVDHAVHVIAGAGHGYACPDRAGFDPAATEATWRIIEDALRSPAAQQA